MNTKTFVFIVIATLALVELSAQGKSKNKSTYAPSIDVAEQSNSSLYVRRRSEPWEGDDDVEFTKSDEEGLVAPVVAWKKKGRKWQIPYKIDQKSNFTSNNLVNIKKELKEAALKLNVKFKTPRYETYLIIISSLKQCVNNLLQKIPQPYNEINICIDAKLKFESEISRAVAIGLKINEKISYESSEEDENEDREDEDE